MSSNKQIAKNSVSLYIRMGVVMLVMFYTSRVILQVLGTDNFGTWNIINSLIISFSFISTPLVTSTQRFLNYDMGKGGKNLEAILGTSLLIFIIICCVLIILLETGGVWFLNAKMDFNKESMQIVNAVYQLMITSLIFKILRLPFEATVIAYEKMSFYAIISITETILLLVIVFILKIFSSYSILITYGILFLCVHIIITTSYVLYCLKKFDCVKIKINYNKQYFKKITSFSGWNLMQSIAAMTATSGLNIIVNIFFGVAVNAAYGLTIQLGGAVNLFVASFQRAVNPQLVKSYAAGDRNRVRSILYNVSKFSYLVIFAIILPLYLNINLVLSIWLGNDIPPYTSIFCKLFLIYTLLMCSANLFDYAILATGVIKKYSIVISCCIFLNIILTYILFKDGFPVYSLFVIKVLVELVLLLIRINFLLKKNIISLNELWKTTIKPSLLVTFLIGIFYMWLYTILESSLNFKHLILSLIIYFPVFVLLCWQIALTKDQKGKLIIKMKYLIDKGFRIF